MESMGHKSSLKKLPISMDYIKNLPEGLSGRLLITQDQETISSLSNTPSGQRIALLYGYPDILNSPKKTLAVEGLLELIGKISIEQPITEIARQLRILSQKRKSLFLSVPKTHLEGKKMQFLEKIKEHLPSIIFYALPSPANYKDITVFTSSNQWYLFQGTPPFQEISSIMISTVQGRYILKINDQSPSMIIEKLGIDPKAISNLFLIKRAGDSTSSVNIKRLLFDRLELERPVKPGKYTLGYFLPYKLLSFIEEICSRKDIPGNGVVLFLSLSIAYKFLEKEKREIVTSLQKASSHFIVIGLEFLIDLKGIAQSDSGFALIGRW